jgi:hypothetical protein
VIGILAGRRMCRRSWGIRGGRWAGG